MTEVLMNFVTRPASNVDRRTPFGSEKKMRNAHISEMRSKVEFIVLNNNRHLKIDGQPHNLKS
jgi:hypothetical protein